MKKNQFKRILFLSLVIGLTFGLPFISNAADCLKANSIGCFDRTGMFHPKDIKGLPPCCPVA
ncbi:hypothetical protein [Cognataquiflexum aquatile]|uniref:hypothetical protein n=1 Tax=Cognataquiflexum aquatile TaxID=2249427 RepID=UPI000DE89377|nr:hypothetical protein [Cognataquiflexum aquatile]